MQSQLDLQGHALIPGLVDENTCTTWISHYNQQEIYRKTVIMERHRFGRGEYKYFDYPLPDSVSEIRQALYPFLAPMANRWMRFLNMEQVYPMEHEAFLKTCHEQGQLEATPLILKYEKGGFNTLHQDLYGPVYFPLQVVLFLSDYGQDYQGGEFVMTEQVPRTQSKAMVVQPSKGDALIFSTNFRPVRGQRGYFRANLRHGVSEVIAGNRYTLGIIFHDALQ
ncbi:MAG: 2OG-Fe(II) oxygenase [Cytophagales bacterium]|nr:2OG-Fe(II) oxygenase [Cytophagales bacterium]